jgi:hypothetical protein
MRGLFSSPGRVPPGMSLAATVTLMDTTAASASSHPSCVRVTLYPRRNVCPACRAPRTSPARIRGGGGNTVHTRHNARHTCTEGGGVLAVECHVTRHTCTEGGGILAVECHVTRGGAAVVKDACILLPPPANLPARMVRKWSREARVSAIAEVCNQATDVVGYSYAFSLTYGHVPKTGSRQRGAA